MLSLLRRYADPQRATTLLLAAIAGVLWAFIELAEEVLEGETRRFDELLLLALRNPADASDPLGPGWLEEMMRDFTALGGIGVLTLISLAVVGYLVLARRQYMALLVTAAVGGGLLLSTLLKLGFDRPRPALVPHETIVYTASFPSGHSMLSAVTYLTLGVLLARVQSRRRLRAYILTSAIMVTLLVGVSRVYLGVHWPTDVLAGWAAGTAWALLCGLIARWLQRRGRVEGVIPNAFLPINGGVK